MIKYYKNLKKKTKKHYIIKLKENSFIKLKI